MAELLHTSLFSDANLQSYYRFEGNSNDSKSSVNGSDSNMSYGVSSGKYGQGALFNGSNAQINLGNNFGFDRGSAFSLAGWVYLLSGSAFQDIFNKQQTSGSFTGYGLEFNTSNQLSLFLRVSGGSGNNIAGTIPAFSLNVWTHVVVTYSGNSNVSGIGFYVNGVSQSVSSTGEGSTISSSITNSVNAAWGARNNNGSLFLNGYLDDWGIFNRVLTAREASLLYSNSFLGAMI